MTLTELINQRSIIQEKRNSFDLKKIDLRNEAIQNIKDLKYLEAEEESLSDKIAKIQNPGETIAEKIVREGKLQSFFLRPWCRSIDKKIKKHIMFGFGYGTCVDVYVFTDNSGFLILDKTKSTFEDFIRFRNINEVIDKINCHLQKMVFDACELLRSLGNENIKSNSLSC